MAKTTTSLDRIDRESASRLRGGGTLALGIRETAPKDRTPAARDEMGTLKRAMGGRPDTAKASKRR